jgi:hypothetical protein
MFALATIAVERRVPGYGRKEQVLGTQALARLSHTKV